MDRPIIVPSQAWEGNNIEDGSVIQLLTSITDFTAPETPNLTSATRSQIARGFRSCGRSMPITRLFVLQMSTHRVGLQTCSTTILMPDGSFRMYVHAFDGIHDRGFLFVSSNFPNIWTLANGGNPIFIEGDPGQWDSYQIQTQIVIPSFDAPDGLWHLFYLGRDSVVLRGGHATSPDGIRRRETELIPL